MGGVEVVVEDIIKSFGKIQVIRNARMRAPAGRVTTLLGPSGCGKTTLLKIIAGLLFPDSGRVLFDGRDVTRVPPEKRNIGIVFQDLALFPHLNVYDNVAFGLKARRVPEAEVRRRVFRALELVSLEPGIFAFRRVTELSGGQRQRVALARTIVIEPDVLLLDEPLAHLDFKVKQRLLREIKKLQRELGITTIYVTHDQTEAMEVGDYIAIMRDGRIVQEGEPEEVYEHPANSFVASFFGDANIVDLGGGEGLVAVRPEDVLVNPSDGHADYRLPGVVEDRVSQGPLIRLEIRVNTGRETVIKALVPRGQDSYSPGQKVIVGWKREAMKPLRG